MKKLNLLVAAITLLCSAFGAKAIGWPANYQGVMLQGFYWDSYKPYNWAQLTSMSDELSKYFSLIWVPNSAKPASNPSMGYDPVYWFTNHNSSFGTEAQLRTMISTYKNKGVGIIEDVVVNHRSGYSNWYNFPSETWNGKTYHLTERCITSGDEVWADGGHGCPASYKGNADTGEDFNGSRDLDHTNPTVQDHIKDYCKFLLQDLGYVGFRLDMVKGYGGQYTKIYNQYSRPQFCVGECFDGNYDVCAAWIEATGKESAAFDFPLKFQLNKAFPSASSYNLKELCWTNPSGQLQPAGLIHYGYTQLSVTFVENHDTDRDHNKFNGNVLAANAFIICSPGTPCVFLRHYLNNKDAIQKMIDARNSVGVHNLSSVNVLKCESNCYMAEVTGTKGKLVVRIGTTSDQPSGSGYTLKCSGNGYSIWTTSNGGQTPSNPGGNTGGNYPAQLHLMGHTNGYSWATDKGLTATGQNGVYNWSNVTIDDSGDGSGYFAFATVLGGDWDAVNSGDRYGAQSADLPIAKGQSATIKHYPASTGEAGGSQSWKIPAGSYSITADLAQMKITVSEAGSKPDLPSGQYPSTLYLIGHTNGYEWATDKGVAATGQNGVYIWNDLSIDDSGDGSGYFAFATVLGADWDAVNGGDRYGATSSDLPIANGQSADIRLYAVNVDASGSQSWKIAPGKYTITADLASMKLTVGNTNGVDSMEADEAQAAYFNLQGVQVENPAPGIYIRVCGGKATKVRIR